MANVVIGLYDDLADARDTVQELTDSGFKRDEINIISNNAVKRQAAQVGTKESNMLSGGTAGAMAGGVAGALVGLAALAIPGIGPVLAAGPLLAFFGGAAGTVAGSFIGAFTDWGIRDADAQYYAEGVRRGGTLVAVKTDGDTAQRAAEIVNRHHPVDIQQRVARWHEAGWTKFDPAAKPYSAEEIARDHALHGGSTAPTDVASALGGQESALQAGKLPGMLSFEDQQAAFREHYQRNYANSGHDFDYYLPAYRYGYGLANDERYADKEWSMVEPELRRFWDEYQSNSWDEFKKAILFARDKGRGRV